MKTKFFLLILTGIFSRGLFAQPVAFLPEETPFEQVLKQAKSEQKIIMLDLYTDWCVWCKKLDQNVYQNAEIGKFSARLLNLKKNAEKGDGIEIAKKYRPTGYPCILFVDGAGEEIDRIGGYLEPDAFLQRLVKIYMGTDTYVSLKSQVEKHPDDVSVAFKLAEKYAARGDAAHARDLYRKILKIDPNNQSGFNASVRFQLGNMAVQGNQLDEAEEHFTAILANHPNFEGISYVYRSLAWVYTTRQQPKKAVQLLEDGIQKLPAETGKDALYYFLSMNYSLLGENQKSIDILKNISKSEVDPFLIQTARARSYFRMSEPEKGLEILAAEFEKVKTDPQKVNDIAWQCVEEKVTDARPIAWAETAAGLSNRDPLILDTLAELYALNRRLAEAIQTEEEALAKLTDSRYQSQFTEKIAAWKVRLTE
jgi:tetratricopeptide (TPR) repeat protein